MILVAALAVVALALVGAVGLQLLRGPRILAERHAQVVADLPPYGQELRALEPYGESPADADPRGATGRPEVIRRPRRTMTVCRLRSAPNVGDGGCSRWQSDSRQRSN